MTAILRLLFLPALVLGMSNDGFNSHSRGTIRDDCLSGDNTYKWSFFSMLAYRDAMIVMNISTLNEEAKEGLILPGFMSGKEVTGTPACFIFVGCKRSKCDALSSHVNEQIAEENGCTVIEIKTGPFLEIKTRLNSDIQRPGRWGIKEKLRIEFASMPCYERFAKQIPILLPSTDAVCSPSDWIPPRSTTMKTTTTKKHVWSPPKRSDENSPDDPYFRWNQNIALSLGAICMSLFILILLITLFSGYRSKPPNEEMSMDEKGGKEDSKEEITTFEDMIEEHKMGHRLPEVFI